MTKLRIISIFSLIFIGFLAAFDTASAGSASIRCNGVQTCYINPGDAPTISWSSSGVTTCNVLDGSRVLYSGTSGSVRPTLYNSITYTLACHNGNPGQEGWNDSALVLFNASYSTPYASPYSTPYNTPYAYQYQTPNQYGYQYQNPYSYQYPTPHSSESRPRVRLTADDTRIDEGDSTYIRWEVDDADSCRSSGGTNGWSGKNRDEDSGRFNTGDLFDDETFTLTCENDEGTTRDSVTIRVDDDNDDDRDTRISSSRVVTTCSSATFNGYLNNTDNERTGVWFEWGSDRDLEERTPIQVFYRDTDFSELVTGIKEDSTYYYRPVASNQGGTDRGSIVRFSTPSCRDNNGGGTTGLTAVTSPATGISLTAAQINSAIYLSDNRKADAWFEWGPTANLGNTTRSVSVGNLINANNEIISNLVPGTTYYFRAVAENASVRNYGIVRSFRTSGGNTGSSSTTNTNNNDDTEGSVLGANVSWAGFFPDSLFGWLFLLILLFILVLLARQVRREFGPTSHVHDHN